MRSSIAGGISLFASDEGLIVQRTVVFAPETGLALDICRPERTTPRTPVVVFFYGGSSTRMRVDAPALDDVTRYLGLD